MTRRAVPSRRWAIRVASATSLAGLSIVIGPGVALADNCSSLSDCWTTAAGAASAAAGAAAGAIGGLFGGSTGSPAPAGPGAGRGPSTASGGGGSVPTPTPSATPAPDNFPHANPGEPTGAAAGEKRVRDYYRDVHLGKKPPRTSDQVMDDFQRTVEATFDLDDLHREHDRWLEEQAEKRMPYAQRG